MIKEYLLKKTLDASLSAAKKILSESNINLVKSKQDIEESIRYHVRSIKNWSTGISFNDLKKIKRTTDVFIELDLFVYPRRLRIHPDEKVESIPLRNIFECDTKHSILLGQPGAGKTTSMKYLCQSLFLDEKFPNDKLSFPILIKFRDLNALLRATGSASIIDELFNILGLELEIPEERLKNSSLSEIQSVRETGH
jgi:predicted NACHT family NTPase